MNKSLEIARKQQEHSLARGKAGMWSYQIWFVSRTVAATAQGSGVCCGESFFSLHCGTGVATTVTEHPTCFVWGFQIYIDSTWGGWRGEIWMWGRRIWLNIMLLLNFYSVAVFQVTALRETLIPTASVLCPICISCSSVTCIDFFSLVKTEVDISYTFGAAENKTNACPENSLVVQSLSPYPSPGKQKAHS